MSQKKINTFFVIIIIILALILFVPKAISFYTRVTDKYLLFGSTSNLSAQEVAQLVDEKDGEWPFGLLKRREEVIKLAEYMNKKNLYIKGEYYNVGEKAGLKELVKTFNFTENTE